LQQNLNTYPFRIAMAVGSVMWKRFCGGQERENNTGPRRRRHLRRKQWFLLNRTLKLIEKNLYLKSTWYYIFELWRNLCNHTWWIELGDVGELNAKLSSVKGAFGDEEDWTKKKYWCILKITNNWYEKKPKSSTSKYDSIVKFKLNYQ
jgi:hypothetical protein